MKVRMTAIYSSGSHDGGGIGGGVDKGWLEGSSAA